MKPYFLFGFLLFATSAGFAQSLTDQIEAVDAAQMRHKVEETRIHHQKREEAHKQALAVEQRAEKKRAAELSEKQKKEAEKLADKQRDQAYQDQLRAIEIQKQSLQVDMEKAKAARANEYVDQDLKAKAAVTDVIQSNADANRALSSGVKSYLEKAGESEEKNRSETTK